eukprot:14364091-Ditylum_brightwellii.AAC.1
MTTCRWPKKANDDALHLVSKGIWGGDCRFACTVSTPVYRRGRAWVESSADGFRVGWGLSSSDSGGVILSKGRSPGGAS